MNTLLDLIRHPKDHFVRYCVRRSLNKLLDKIDNKEKYDKIIEQTAIWSSRIRLINTFLDKLGEVLADKNISEDEIIKLEEELKSLINHI